MTTACLSKNFTDFIINCSGGKSWTVDMEKKAPNWLAVPLYGYVAPPIILITVLTNCFVVLVLSRSHLRTPTNMILLVMALTEMFAGLSSLPWFTYYYTFQYYRTDLSDGLPAFWCHAFPTFADYMPTIFHTATMWLTVYLAAQRCIYVCMTQVAQFWCTMTRTRCVITFICLSAFLFELPKCLASYNISRSGFNPAEINAFYANRSVMVNNRWKTRYCIWAFSDWLENWLTPDIFFTVYYWTFALLVHTIPCICLVIFTTILLVHIRRADKRRKSSFVRSNSTRHPQQLSKPTIVKLKSAKNRKTTYNASSFSEQESPSMPNNNTFRVGSFRSRGSPELGKSASSCRLTLPVTSMVASTSSTKVSVSHAFSKKKYYHSTTKMLIVVIIIILIIEIPIAAIFVLHVCMLKMPYGIINSALIVRNVLILLSYPFNFAIYCGMSQQFRCTVNHLLFRRSRSLGGDRGTVRGYGERFTRLPTGSFAGPCLSRHGASVYNAETVSCGVIEQAPALIKESNNGFLPKKITC